MHAIRDGAPLLFLYILAYVAACATLYALLVRGVNRISR